MSKNRLVIQPDYDFELLGITCHSREYKLAWELNRQLGIRLIKQDDITLDLVREGQLIFSNYLFENGPVQYKLIRNKSVNQSDNKVAFLLPELQNFDFLFIIKGNPGGDIGIISKIKGIPLVNFVSRFEISDIKAKENLIF
ncbi:MAG TPA: IPExxxVDY family protein [Cyclobacteriaceae bacterium]|nr:IPExxxVDY family protein [Cyclobacteriaceae bacterium]